jgi:hypothetical protein
MVAIISESMRFCKPGNGKLQNVQNIGADCPMEENVILLKNIEGALI